MNTVAIVIVCILGLVPVYVLFWIALDSWRDWRKDHPSMRHRHVLTEPVNAKFLTSDDAEWLRWYVFDPLEQMRYPNWLPPPPPPKGPGSGSRPTFFDY